MTDDQLVEEFLTEVQESAPHLLECPLVAYTITSREPTNNRPFIRKVTHIKGWFLTFTECG